MVKEIMGKRGVSTLCNNLLKKLTRDDFLSGCRRVVAPDFVKRGTSSFHTLTSSNQTPQLCQKHQSSQVCHLPQLDVPDVPADLFKGMSTEFPCLTRNKMTGPEPEYDKIVSGFKSLHYQHPFEMKYNKARLPELHVAYETWGKLNESKSNAVLIQAGLSASSHAKSHRGNVRPGWWEKFVGPGCAVDTDEFFIICPNNLGSCYGTTGPSSINPLTGKPYATTFPLVSVDDMVKANFLLLDALGIDKLHACVGSSLGGMLSLMAAAEFPERVGRIISISSCAQSHPSSIAMRYLQRKTIMCDPHWNKGHYYDGPYPKVGMKLAREIATMTYRSGPEWDQRFSRNKIDPNGANTLCPTFTIESYLEHQGESFSTKYDPNSLLYISKAMDLFDMAEGYGSLKKGLSRVKCPVMVVGVQTDILFPIWQQRELAKVLQESGNLGVTFYELNSLFGHDTFLLDINGVGAAVKGFLETNLKSLGIDFVNKETMQENMHSRERIFF
ncbi:serine O-succinyltransferase-like isoform X2 [Ostrea edulis]|uniref:serine O-succinyltransferase-like isoform X2 n=1 Tax=Ostrea edulis TaxID=37623 RepID=UPI002095D681|nr:serine O-succinyltransferase-like isoform X2 [Ostrea edulis]XP_048775709.1 serine O-succinyltransferase-like isoform X2 [Ostrea edulis]XP_056009850.1 serine O-succinyltransferase-like isoform X2 [Ostrea edulis]